MKRFLLLGPLYTIYENSKSTEVHSIEIKEQKSMICNKGTKLLPQTKIVECLYLCNLMV